MKIISLFVLSAWLVRVGSPAHTENHRPGMHELCCPGRWAIARRMVTGRKAQRAGPWVLRVLSVGALLRSGCGVAPISMLSGGGGLGQLCSEFCATPLDPMKWAPRRERPQLKPSTNRQVAVGAWFWHLDTCGCMDNLRTEPECLLVCQIKPKRLKRDRMFTFHSFLPKQVMSQGGKQERTQRKVIEETLAQHKLAVGGARQNPEGRVAEVVDAAPIDEVATSSPKKRAPNKGQMLQAPERREKEQIQASIMNGNSHRNVSKIFGVSLGSTSKIMHSTAEELSSKTHSGGRRESIAKVTPEIISNISALAFAHPSRSYL